MMLHRCAIAVVLLGAAGAADAQEMDMEAMQKWAAADEVRYHIVGAYEETTYIASDGAGQADVTDSVTIDLTWKLSEAKLVGEATIQNAPSAVANLRDREPSCLPPVLGGAYERYELVAVRDAQGVGGMLELESRTTHPVVEVAQSCTASRLAVPAEVKSDTEYFALPTPIMLAMPLPESEELEVTADKKSFIVRKDGWTWTITPTAEGGA